MLTTNRVFGGGLLVTLLFGCASDSETGSDAVTTSTDANASSTATEGSVTGANTVTSPATMTSTGPTGPADPVGPASTSSTGTPDATGSTGAMDPTGGTGGSNAGGSDGTAAGSGGAAGSSGGETSGGAGGTSGSGPAAAGAGGATMGEGGGAGGDSDDEPFDGMELFLLFGQSNMAGSAQIESQDNVENPRVKVLGMYDCGGNGRVYNEWAVARPPLHSCGGGLGPADSFAKALAEAWPDSEIGLVPNAVPGVEINFFRKGMISNQDQSYKELPNGYESAYEMMIDRALLAQESGRFRGILFHQGESDSGQAAWVDKVAEIVADLRADLGLGEDVPFIPGELGCCGGHNSLVRQLPDQIPNTVVVSAEGLTIFDQYHFDSPSVRTFGQRYTDAFLELVPNP